jgi:hypothetical protein
LIGCDISQLDDFTLSLLTNSEVIEINQDPLGKQAQRVWTDGEIQGWVKDLEDGSKAVGIFNLGEADKPYHLLFSSVGISKPGNVRDVWRQKTIREATDSLDVFLPSHGVILLKIQ